MFTINIKTLLARKPWILAPMSTTNSYPFRQLCSELGADLVVTPLISAKGVINDLKYKKKVYQSKIYYSTEKEGPVIIQLFGNDPEYFGKAITYLTSIHKYAGVEVNAGCPKFKVTKRGSGSSLLKPPLDNLREILINLKENSSIPVGLKTRLGWDPSLRVIGEVLKLAEELELDWVAVHGRYKVDDYKTPATKDYIQEIPEDYQTPILANGDINSVEDVENYLKERVYSGVLIGRKARRFPHIFSRRNPDDITIHEKIKAYSRLIEIAKEHGFYSPIFAKINLAALINSHPLTKPFHLKIMRQKKLEEIEKSYNDFLDNLEEI